MSTVTTNYNLVKPAVNDPTDADLWGTELNTNMDTIDTTMKSISDVANEALAASTGAQLPIGSLYFNASDATNPASLLGYGTWAAFGQGVVLLGVGTGTDINSQTLTVTAGATGGEYKHTLTIAETPAHHHLIHNASGGGGALPANPYLSQSLQSTAQLPADGQTDTIGGGGSHNITQPYIGVYIWQRTA